MIAAALSALAYAFLAGAGCWAGVTIHRYQLWR